MAWWLEMLSDFAPTICRPLSKRFGWLVYTDAATNPPCLCALLFDMKKRPSELDTVLTAFARPWNLLFKRTCLIFGLELLALAAFLEEKVPFLAGKTIWIYMGNNNCLAAVARGYSDAEAIAVLVCRIWRTLQRYQICAWFSRVPSKQYPADLPTRARKLPPPARRKASFKSIASPYGIVRNSFSNSAQNIGVGSKLKFAINKAVYRPYSILAWYKHPEVLD